MLNFEVVSGYYGEEKNLILAGTSAILTGVVCGFTQYPRQNYRIMP
jgi:hypothetical protein